MIKLFKENLRLLSFCILCASFSAFGQTFILSLFNESLMMHLGIDRVKLSTLYAFATLFSGLTVARIGVFSDKVLLKYLFFLGVGLSVCGYLALLSPYWGLTLIALYVLRVSAQGIFTILSKSTLVKRMGANRGKALSISGLGHLIAESFFPFFIVWGLENLSFSKTIMILSCFMLLLFLIGGFILLKENSFQNENLYQPSKQSLDSVIWKSPKFWLISSCGMMIPFFLTGIIFHNDFFINSFGWSDIDWAKGFVGFALCRFLFSFLSGFLIDRFGASRIFPCYLIPYIVILVTLLLNPFSSAYFFLSFCGASIGLAGPIVLSTYGENFKLSRIGEAHGFNSMVMILATSASPYLFGLVIDSGFSALEIIKFVMITVLSVFIISIMIKKKVLNLEQDKKC